MDAPASAPPPESLPFPWHLLLHALPVPLWGACNPLALAAAFLLAPHHRTGINVDAWSPGSFLPVGTATAMGMMLLGYVLLRATNGGKASPTRLAWGLHVAQLPFLPLLALPLLAFQGLEGNIVGFFIFPATAAWLLVSVPASLALLVAWVLWARRANAGPGKASAGS